MGLNRAGGALRIAVQHAQGINIWQLGPAQVRDLQSQLEAACESAGRDPATLELISDAIAEQAGRFQDAGVSEPGVVLSHVDELHWFSEDAIPRLRRTQN